MRQLVVTGRPVLPAQRQHPHGALRYEVRGVHRESVAVGAAVETVEVLADRAPVERHRVVAGPAAVPAGDLAAQLAEGAVVHGRVRQPVLADDLQRHALRGLGGVRGVAQQGEVGVGVHVDEAGGEDEAPGVEDGAAGEPRADGRDPAAGQPHVGAVSRRPRAVDDEGAADHQVHVCRSPVPLRRRSVRTP
ncbi:hypothetical protein AA958_22445 [Streptomyces sp. CNQ-509]|nr:hypothetical protein AA958_22445 [Streptomyces sp. CNQ-509]